MIRRLRPARGPVDWVEIRRRVEAAADESATSQDRVRQVLEQRARALAQPTSSLPVGDVLELITFSLADDVYAIESRYVMAVFPLRDFSRLPGAEPPVFGVTAWRGALLTLLDLRQVLGLSVAALDDLSRVIVVGEDRPSFGILADTARDLLRLPASELRSLPDGLGRRREYLRGISSEAVLVLEAKQLLRAHA